MKANQEMIDAAFKALISFRKSGGDYRVHPHHAVEAAIKAAFSAYSLIGYVSTKEMRHLERHRKDGSAASVPVYVYITDEDRPSDGTPIYAAIRTATYDDPRD